MATNENNLATHAPSPDAAGDGHHVHQFASIETVENLTLTLLKEVESLKERESHKHHSRLRLYDEVRRFETEMIEWALFRTGGNQRRAARLLDIKVTTLNAKIKRYGIEPNAALSNLLDLYTNKPAVTGT